MKYHVRNGLIAVNVTSGRAEVAFQESECNQTHGVYDGHIASHG